MENKSKTKKCNLFVLIPVAVIIVLLYLFIERTLLSSFAPGPSEYRHIRARLIKAESQIKGISTGLDMYKLDTKEYPSQETGLSALLKKPDSVEGWHGPYLKENTTKDPWGREFIYKFPGKPGTYKDYDIIYHGADGLK